MTAPEDSNQESCVSFKQIVHLSASRSAPSLPLSLLLLLRGKKGRGRSLSLSLSLLLLLGWADPQLGHTCLQPMSASPALGNLWAPGLAHPSTRRRTPEGCSGSCPGDPASASPICRDPHQDLKPDVSIRALHCFAGLKDPGEATCSRGFRAGAVQEHS